MAVEGPVVFTRAHSMIVHRHSLGKPEVTDEEASRGPGSKKGAKLEIWVLREYIRTFYFSKNSERP